MSDQRPPNHQEIDLQIERICQHESFESGHRGRLLQFLVRTWRAGAILLNGTQHPLLGMNGKQILQAFYQEHYGRSSSKGAALPQRSESAGKWIVDDLDTALRAYYSTHATERDQILVTVKRGRVAKYRVAYDWRFASEAGKAVPQPRPIDVDTRTNPAEPASEERLTRMFWKPHLTSARATHIAYGMPVFMQSEDKMSYTRRVEENDPKVAQAKFPNERISWPFVTTGDVLCTFRTSNWITSRGFTLTTNGYNAQSSLEFLRSICGPRANVLAVGSIRVNGVLNEYQKARLDPVRSRSHLPFQIDLHEVTHVAKNGRPSGVCFRDRGGEGELQVPVVITRREGKQEGFVTLIASNNGRAVQRVGEILTDEDLLGELFKEGELAAWTTAMPDRFQIILYVEVKEDSSFAGRAHVEHVWSD